MRITVFLVAMVAAVMAFGQDPSEQVEKLELEIARQEVELKLLRAKADSLRLSGIYYDLEQMGWPGNEGQLVQHSAMALSYSEEHEQPFWVAHIILPEVATGRVERTNDYREDTLVNTQTAQDADYFLKERNTKGNWEYDGYGYDRGHLAPSADFKWNRQALSETYYYSNMSPQRPEFNRGGWAGLEGHIRNYVIDHKVKVYVVTGPVLNSETPKVERSINGMSLPDQYYKVVYDPENKIGMGFLMPNAKITKPHEAYAISIDQVEKLTGLDFFPNESPEWMDAVEAQTEAQIWFGPDEEDKVKILDRKDLGEDQYNTLQAHDFIGEKKKVEVCGTVVSTFKSKSNNVFMDFDRKYPEKIFSVAIWARNVSNFSYAPEKELLNKKVCVTGRVEQGDGYLQMSIKQPTDISLLDGEKGENF
jgi:endonuclease G